MALTVRADEAAVRMRLLSGSKVKEDNSEHGIDPEKLSLLMVGGKDATN